jgi:hypothetical protein
MWETLTSLRPNLSDEDMTGLAIIMFIVCGMALVIVFTVGPWLERREKKRKQRNED